MRYLALTLLGLLGAVPSPAQLADPRLGCFTYQQAAYEILGVPDNWIVRATDTCAPVESAWHIVEEPDNTGPWLERHDALSHAVEARQHLEPGTWAVFADGTALQLDALQLPGALQGWTLVAPNWILVRTEQALVLLRADREWFYLPAPQQKESSAPPPADGDPAP